jgi:hypothetical protein
MTEKNWIPDYWYYYWFEKLNQIDGAGLSFLRACQNNDHDIYSKLSCVDQTFFQSTLFTGIHILCRYGHFQTLKSLILLANEHDHVEKTVSKKHCIFLSTRVACQCGHLNIVTWLIEEHGALSVPHEIVEYLTWAWSSHQFEVVAYLLTKNCFSKHDVDDWLVWKNKYEVAKHYLNYGLNPDLLPGKVLRRTYRSLSKTRKNKILLLKDCLDRILCTDLLSCCCTFISY